MTASFSRPIAVLSLGLIVVWAGPASARPDACAQVLRHSPSPDVAYRAGVDVKGRAVIPADLEPPAFDLPEEITFEILIPMRRADAGRFDRRDYYGEALAGLLTLHGDGRVSINGRPLERPQQEALRAACDASLRTR